LCFSEGESEHETENHNPHVRRRHLERSLRFYRDGLGLATEEIIGIQVVDAFRQVDIEAMRERASSWFSSFGDAIGVEMRDLSVSVSGDTAFTYSVNRYFGKLRSGGALDMCVRVTVWLRKMNGHWMITHEEHSVPFDSKSAERPRSRPMPQIFCGMSK
jgi:ketosteroid isomerase-like protein